VFAQRESQPVSAVSNGRIPEPDSERSALACPNKLGVQKLLLRCEVFEFEWATSILRFEIFVSRRQSLAHTS
jgi:hypothetical protein